LSHPAVRRKVIDAFVDLAQDFEPFDLVAGVATAGIPHGVLLADRLGLPFVYVREKPKSHGRQNQIEGVVRGGERVLVVEDLISTGGSSLNAVAALRAAGCTVAAVLAIFGYGFPQAEQAFREAGCPFATLSDYDTLLQQAVADGYVSQPELDRLREWRRAPQEWA
jgi:orotate phosphoribosyltransferase